MKKFIKCALAALMVAGLSYTASALTIGDSRYLGLIEYGIPSGDADRTAYVNHLIDMANTSSDTALGQTFTRSSNYAPGSLVDAVWAANGGNSGSYDVGTGGYLYLFAKYDGPNYGAEVWYIGGLTGTITIPTTAGGYGLSGVTFFNPGTPPPGVPDGGLTLALLGSAVGMLGFIRRKTSV